MITGVHFLLYSKDPAADRVFLRDVLKLRAIDIGEGWLLFALPPTEMAVHPSDKNFVQRHAGHNLMGAIVYLMCDDLKAAINSMEAAHVACGPITEAEWGTATTIRLPSGGELGLYQPTHRTALRKAGG